MAARETNGYLLQGIGFAALYVGAIIGGSVILWRALPLIVAIVAPLHWSFEVWWTISAVTMIVVGAVCYIIGKRLTRPAKHAEDRK